MRASAPGSCSGWSTSAEACESSASLSASCCGRMRRPFGAASSMGQTSTTVSPGLRRPPKIGFSRAAGRGECATARRRASTPSPVVAHTANAGAPPASRETASRRSAVAGVSSMRFTATKTCGGDGRAAAAARISRSLREMPVEASVTTIATSAPRISPMAREARARPISTPPRCSVSSMPAVSTTRHGPRGSHSTDFATGSAVVPGTGETMDTGWLASAFTSADLPAFLRPNTTMRTRSETGAETGITCFARRRRARRRGFRTRRGPWRGFLRA